MFSETELTTSGDFTVAYAQLIKKRRMQRHGQSSGDKLYEEQFHEPPRFRPPRFNYEPLNEPEQPQRKPANYEAWGPEQQAIWEKKPIEEVERYFINLQNYISKLRIEHEKEGTLKPYALIRKKKQWRNGLREILARDPAMAKHYGKMTKQKTTKTSKESASLIPASSSISVSTATPKSSSVRPLKIVEEARAELAASLNRRAQKEQQVAARHSQEDHFTLGCDEVIDEEDDQLLRKD